MQSIHRQRYALCVCMVTMVVIAVSASYALHETKANGDSVPEQPQQPLIGLERTITKAQVSDRTFGPMAPTETYRMYAQTTDKVDSGDEGSVESRNVEKANSIPEPPSYYLKLVPPEDVDSGHDVKADLPSDSIFMLVQAARMQRLPLSSPGAHLLALHLELIRPTN